MRKCMVLVWFLYFYSTGAQEKFMSMEDQNPPSRATIIEGLLDSIAMAESEGNEWRAIYHSNKLMIHYSLMKNLNQARELGQKTLKRALYLADSCLLGQTYNHYGIVLNNHKEYDRFKNEPAPDFFMWADSAIHYFRKSISTGDKGCELNPEGWGYSGLMRTHFFIARMSHKNFDSALHYSQVCRDIAIERDDLELEQSANVWAARSYSHLGNYDEAKIHIKRAYDLTLQLNSGYHGVYDVWFGVLAKESGSDSLLWLQNEIIKRVKYQVGTEMQHAIQDADRKYETAKKEEKILLKDKELVLKKQQLVFFGIVLLVVCIISVYLHRLYRKNKRLSLRNELLLKEQNHRVKNNLQMINSLLSLQSQKLLSTDAKEALNESQLRINSVALLHRMLYEGEKVGLVNAKEYLNTLTEEITYSVPREIILQLQVSSDLNLAIEKATSLGLIINELMTNSIKHVDEKVQLAIGITLSESENQLILSYADNGSGISKEVWNTSKSFGNQLIKLQSEQLRGSYEIINENGFKYELKIGA